MTTLAHSYVEIEGTRIHVHSDSYDGPGEHSVDDSYFFHSPHSDLNALASGQCNALARQYSKSVETIDGSRTVFDYHLINRDFADRHIESVSSFRLNHPTSNYNKELKPLQLMAAELLLKNYTCAVYDGRFSDAIAFQTESGETGVTSFDNFDTEALGDFIKNYGVEDHSEL